MSPIVDHDSEKKASSIDDHVVVEKHHASINIDEGDEALRLIGMERTAQFSEEYNRKLRRKLVCPSRHPRVLISQIFEGLVDSATMRRSVLHTVFVRLRSNPQIGSLMLIQRDKTSLNYAR